MTPSISPTHSPGEQTPGASSSTHSNSPLKRRYSIGGFDERIPTHHKIVAQDYTGKENRVLQKADAAAAKIFRPDRHTFDTIRRSLETEKQKLCEQEENAAVEALLSQKIPDSIERNNIRAQVTSSAARVTAYCKGGFCFYGTTTPTGKKIKACKIIGKLQEGSQGAVYKVNLLKSKMAQGAQVAAVKVAKAAESHSSIMNEYNLLTKLHQDTGIRGIQRAPHVILRLSDGNLGYLTPLHDGDLFDLISENKTVAISGEQFLYQSLSLFEGLHFLHARGIVHGDIKPENLCLEENEFRLADFGGARRITDIVPRNILGTHTPETTSFYDEKVCLKYYARQLVINGASDNEIKYQLKQVCSIRSDPALENRIINEAIEYGRSSSRTPAELQQRAIEVARGHDVHALAVSLEEMAAQINKNPKLAMNRDLERDFTILLREMQYPDYTKRLTIGQAKAKYIAILQKHHIISQPS